MGWVDAIADLYRLNELRLQASANAQAGTPPAQPRQLALEPTAPEQVALEQAVQAMAARRATELADPTLAEPAAKVLRSMAAHWDGLTVFVTRPWVPMGRVEMWRGGGRSRHRCFRPFRLAVPYEPDRSSVSTSPSSNRTCATNASGSLPTHQAFAFERSRAGGSRRISLNFS